MVRSIDVHFKPNDEYLHTEIQIQCSNPNCDHEHRHFQRRATRRECIAAWNARNSVGKSSK